MRLTTRDGVRLAGLQFPAGNGAVPGLAVVLCHGFTNTVHTASFQRIARRLTRHGSVLAVDFRGHGRSGGGSTVGGDAELDDVDAVVAWARGAGYEQVVTVGLSMGGGVVLRHAALRGGVDAVVSVSAVSRWYVRDTLAMRRVNCALETGLGRAVCRYVLRTRLGPPWTVLPTSPIEVLDRLAPTALLIVHGDNDQYFPIEHPYALARAAGPSAQVWIVSGFGHAESGLRPDIVDGIGAWIRAKADATADRGNTPGAAGSGTIGA